MKIVRKALKLQKLSKDSSLKGPGASDKQKTVFRDNRGQKVWEKIHIWSKKENLNIWFLLSFY